MALTQEQVAYRINYIGGTDCAGILGISRYKTPIQVWAEKTGLLIQEDISDKLHIKLGNKLEQTVCELFMEETGKTLHRVNNTVFHPRYDFLGANIDRRVLGEDAIFEAKTCAAWKSKEWEGDEEIPADYIMQMMHYLLVTGKKKGYLAVLIGNQDFKWRVVERDEKLLNEILKREVEFWNEYVVKNERPSMVTKNDGETLSRLFPTADPEKEIMLGDEANVLVENLQALKADEKHLGGLIDQVENQLKVLLEDATVGRTSINEIRWANVPSNKFDTGLFKEKEPKMYSEYLRSKIIRRFSAKAIKAPKEN